MNVKVSICIPAYNRVDYLKRLLESISQQTYKNYEVIITDDSDTDGVLNLSESYRNQINIKYYKNVPTAGTPRNWLASIKKAEGEWIKLIHDDDSFANKESLQQFVDATSAHKRFIFSGYNAVFENTNESIDKTISHKKFRFISGCPSFLFASNLLGPPSVLMFHKSITTLYDPNLKWFVDMEYYFRILQKDNAFYIDKPLINVSFNDTQVTTYTRTNPAVVIPESLYIFSIHGSSVASNIIAYDSWWRVYRNLGIRNSEDIRKYSKEFPIPPFIISLLSHQRKIPFNLIKIGAFSKFFMAISYVTNKLGKKI